MWRGEGWKGKCCWKERKKISLNIWASFSTKSWEEWDKALYMWWFTPQKESIRSFNLFVLITPCFLSFRGTVRNKTLGCIDLWLELIWTYFFMFLPHLGLYQVEQDVVGTANTFGVVNVEVWTNFGYTRHSSEALSTSEYSKVSSEAKHFKINIIQEKLF